MRSGLRRHRSTRASTVDPNSRVACETVTKTGFVLLAGEITTKAQLDYPTIVRGVVREIGFIGSEIGFDADYVRGHGRRSSSSRPTSRRASIAATPAKQGAGDQGLMFGYACDETKELMPLPIQMAHQLALKLAEVRKKKAKGIDWLRPDGKTQVSVRYEDGEVTGVEAIVVSTQHDEKVKQKTIEEAIRELVIKPVVPAKLITNKTKFHVNPTGRFVIGGPHGDAGLTGRKIIVDTYGGYARHGGGAFSGKDPSKVDRSAAYYARYIAKHVVAAGLARRCEVQFAYAIGVAEPVSMLVDDLRHRHGLRRQAHQGRARHVRRAPGHADQGARSAPPDLPQDRRLRPLRPRGRGLHVGEDAARREAAGRRALR